MTTPLLKVENLRIALESGGTTFDATESVSFEIGRGEAFGLVEEPLDEAVGEGNLHILILHIQTSQSISTDHLANATFPSG